MGKRNVWRRNKISKQIRFGSQPLPNLFAKPEKPNRKVVYKAKPDTKKALLSSSPIVPKRGIRAKWVKLKENVRKKALPVTFAIGLAAGTIAGTEYYIKTRPERIAERARLEYSTGLIDEAKLKERLRKPLWEINQRNLFEKTVEELIRKGYPPNIIEGEARKKINELTDEQVKKSIEELKRIREGKSPQKNNSAPKRMIMIPTK